MKNMYKKSDDQLLMMQDTIDANRQDSDEKMRKQDYKLDKFIGFWWADFIFEIPHAINFVEFKLSNGGAFLLAGTAV